jgi:hypothetical protein
MTEADFEQYLHRSSGWAIRKGFDVLHSEAFKKINYAPALKVLDYFYEKIKVGINKGRRGKGRYKVMNGDISFPYREAILRGLSSHQFRNALIELHNFGFIDVVKPGSALRGDYTVFSMSDRWRQYGKPNFENKDFPKSVHWRNFGFGRKGEKS